MKRIILYLLFLIFLGLQSCCDDGGTPFYGSTIQNAIRMKSQLDTIYRIYYQNSNFSLSPYAFNSKMHLSLANEYTTLYIFSTKGYDTLTIKVKQELSYETKSSCTAKNYIIKSVDRAKVINYTFDTSYFKYYEVDNYGNKETFDTLIVD